MKIYANLLDTSEHLLSNIEIYPNPVTKNILNIKGKSFNSEVVYEVVNLIGQKVLNGTLSNDQINVSKLNSGTYFLILKHEGEKSIKKFIIQ